MLRLQIERHRNLLGQDQGPLTAGPIPNLGGAAQELDRW